MSVSDGYRWGVQQAENSHKREQANAKKIATVIPLLAVLLIATAIPAVVTPSLLRARAEPPAACLDLVTKLSDAVKKAIAPLTRTI